MSTASSTREAAAGDEALPYDAVLVTDVRIGREDWSHALTRPTFTIAHVYGEVRGVELECAERTERLRYEAGVEWTLPDGWEACTMLVDAAPGTTFALYEFD